MKIVICGATGFIGQNLLNYFDNGDNEIIAVFNKRKPVHNLSEKVIWFKADLRVPGCLKKIIKNTDLFFNLLQQHLVPKISFKDHIYTLLTML